MSYTTNFKQVFENVSSVFLEGPPKMATTKTLDIGQLIFFDTLNGKPLTIDLQKNAN